MQYLEKQLSLQFAEEGEEGFIAPEVVLGGWCRVDCECWGVNFAITYGFCVMEVSCGSSLRS